jgi:two-component system cell cycle response regulator
MAFDYSEQTAPGKPTVLIADDSRIVRATLTKHIEGIFDFREAHDGEEAWEILLRDPNIQLLITDLTMPRLDGYGLLHRMRSSRVQRLNEMPVVVVSGSDDPEERERARAAGATDLVTKGMATPRLLSRLDILAQLIRSQNTYERLMEEKADDSPEQATQALTSPYAFRAEAEAMLRHAQRYQQNFAVLSICLEGGAAGLDNEILEGIGRLLKHTIRQTDSLACTGEAEFTIVSDSLDADAAHGFAKRLCSAVTSIKLQNGKLLPVIASCGIASLQEFRAASPEQLVSLHDLWDITRRRAKAGIRQRVSGAVGPAEESAFVDT